MLLRRFYDDSLAQASYMLGCQRSGEAVVVDPGRRPEPYLAAAAEESVRIVCVTETHIHADFLSGSRELARVANARLLLSDHGDEDWSYRYLDEDGARPLRDGEEFSVGAVSLRVLHTPGHTPEHISFLVTDGGVSGAPADGVRSSPPPPLALLSGDFVFVGDVGRPDLLEVAAGETGTMEASARQLYASLQRFRELPVHVQLLPGHGAGSACGKALGAVPSSTVGYELLANWVFQCADEDEFVAKVLEDQPEPPAYFAHMKRLNRAGPPAPPDRRLERANLHRALSMRHDGWTLLDVRTRAQFAGGHLPESLNVPLTRTLPTWAGWVVPYDRPICVVVETEGQVRPTTELLLKIGLDDVQAFHILSDPAASPELGAVVVLDWDEAERARIEEGAVLVDVRGKTEWDEGRVPGAVRIHLGELSVRVGELPRDRPALLHCRTGHRSAIGASILAAAGHPDVRNVEGGWLDRLARGMDVER